MSSLIDTSKRFVFPIWKTYKNSLFAGELDTSNFNKNIEVEHRYQIELNESVIKKWKEKKTIYTAADILNSASIYNLTENKIILDAKDFIFLNKDEAGPSLINLASKFSENKEINISNEIDLRENGYRINSLVNIELKKYKKLLSREPKFYVGWIEMARLYLILSNIDKAKKCIDTALFLDKTDRFVVRSACRFYIHLNEYEKALDVLIKSSKGKSDPWILSSIIAISEKIQKNNNYFSVARKISNDPLYSNINKSELNASLATSELINGNFKNSKDYFKKSLFHPTDNSLAQILWYNEVDLESKEKLYNIVPSPYEAKTVSLYKEGNYLDSFKNNLKWIVEEPFTTRPINIASYNASIFLENYEEAINIEKLGLMINPNDDTLKNNLIFDLIMNKQMEEAKIQIEKLDSDLTSQSSFKATKGLYFIRNNEFEKGRLLYQEAIKDFKNKNDEYMESLAFLNLKREEINFANKNEISDLLKQLETKVGKRNEKDIKFMFEKIKKSALLKIEENG